MKKLILFLILFCCMGVGAWGQCITGSPAMNICPGGTTTLTCCLPSGGTWTISGGGIATISPSGGVVTVLSAPSIPTNVYATYTYSGVTSAAIVTVNPAPDAGRIGGPRAVCVGSNILLSNAVTGGTWSSGSTATATVSSGGSVHGLSGGSTTIFYSVTSTYGCGSAIDTYAVTVETSAPAAPTIITTSPFPCMYYSIHHPTFKWLSSN